MRYTGRRRASFSSEAGHRPYVLRRHRDAAADGTYQLIVVSAWGPQQVASE